MVKSCALCNNSLASFLGTQRLLTSPFAFEAQKYMEDEVNVQARYEGESVLHKDYNHIRACKFYFLLATTAVRSTIVHRRQVKDQRNSVDKYAAHSTQTLHVLRPHFLVS